MCYVDTCRYMFVLSGDKEKVIAEFENVLIC